MPGHGLKKAHHTGSHGVHSGRSKEVRPENPGEPQRRVVPMVRRRGPAEKDLEGLLTSAMLATDKELGNVIHEVDEVAKAIRAGVDAKSLRETVHPAVWFAVRHVILERELQQLAVTDDLTCFYNRRGFFAAATQQMKLARRNGDPALLFFFDLDNLKDINDAFGHREGDRALVRTADAIEEVFRDSDVVARMDGDEFAVLAIDASGRHQEPILHRLQKQLSKANLEEPRYMLSVSVGIARFNPLEETNLAELMAEAGRSLDEKKRLKSRLFSRNA
jgi:diguanylate cyclase (GGDEF)-like protein